MLINDRIWWPGTKTQTLNLWDSVSAWHLWNLYCFRFSCVRIIVWVAHLLKSSFLATSRMEMVESSWISLLTNGFASVVVSEVVPVPLLRFPPAMVETAYRLKPLIPTETSILGWPVRGGLSVTANVVFILWYELHSWSSFFLEILDDAIEEMWLI